MIEIPFSVLIILIVVVFMIGQIVEAWQWRKLLKIKKKHEWQLIATVPVNKIVMLACDTYDCGWTYDFGWKTEEGKFISSASVHGDRQEIHLPPSHWKLEPEPPFVV